MEASAQEAASGQCVGADTLHSETQTTSDEEYENVVTVHGGRQ